MNNYDGYLCLFYIVIIDNKLKDGRSNITYVLIIYSCYLTIL